MGPATAAGTNYCTNSRKESVIPKHITSTLFLILAATLATSVTPAAGSEPGIRHTLFMAGSVIESSSAGVYLCIGTPEGAEVGQQLDIVQVIRDKTNPKYGVRFQRNKVGTLRIDAIVDEHFARATVISGRAKKGYIVRLSEPAEGGKE